MYIGVIENYGGKKNGNYGFIRALGDGWNDFIFFHVISVKKHSKLIGLISKGKAVGSYVVYDIEDSVDEKRKAKNVCLASELTQEEIVSWINKDQIRAVETIKFLQENCLEAYYKGPLKTYFDDFSHEKVRELAYSRYKNKAINESFCDAIVDYAQTYGYYHVYNHLHEIPLDYETDDQINNLIVGLLDRGHNVSALLCKNPKSLSCISVLKKLNAHSIRNFQVDDSELYKASVKQIVDNNNNLDTLKTIKEKMNFIQICEHTKLMNLLTDNDLKRFLKDIGSMNLSYLTKLLNAIEKTGTKEVVVLALLSFDSENMLNKSIWDLSGRRFKTQFVINTIVNQQFCGKHEHLLHSVLSDYCMWTDFNNTIFDFIVTLRQMEHAPNSEKQNRFLFAHDKIMSYITENFNKEVDITLELDDILPKCQGQTNNQVYLYCDGRPWKSSNKIYCPEGVGHVCPGNKCGYYNECSYETTEYCRTKRLSDVNLTDIFITINFDPDLRAVTDVYNEQQITRWRYSHLLSGYVNQLLQMRPHMICSVCKQHFYPNFEYAKKITARVSPTIYNCNNPAKEHDHNVYLNFCIRCHRVVDSRECERKDAAGYWLCMYCGGSYIYGGENSRTVCPHCMSSHVSVKGGKLIVCSDCGHNEVSKKWKKFPETLPRYSLSNYTSVESDELPF